MARLHVSEKLGPFVVAAALQDLGGDRAAEVLPTLGQPVLTGCPAIWICAGRHTAICHRSPALRSPRGCQQLGNRVDTIGAILNKDIIMLFALHDMGLSINCTYLSYSGLLYDSSDAPNRFTMTDLLVGVSHSVHACLSVVLLFMRKWSVTIQLLAPHAGMYDPPN